MSDLRIGLIGLDTSHAVQFSRRFNDANDPEHVSGARVVAAFPGGSSDFELSRSRVEGFTTELREKYDVRMLPSPAAVAEAVDAVFITSSDGRKHLELFEQTLPARKPTFIDKPFALSGDDAEAILKQAEEAGVAVMSCSALRYADALTAAIEQAGETIVGCDVFGPMALQDTQPGLFWYGIHSVEMMFAIMGGGCREVSAVATDDFELVTGRWNDGRLASIHGLRQGHKQFGGTIHSDKAVAFNTADDDRSFYTPLLQNIVRMVREKRSPVPPGQMVEIIRFIEAANESRSSGTTQPL